MLLLYHHLRYFDNLTCPIYIPLCFYFICCSDRQSSILLYIYIPLCFYFIIQSTRELYTRGKFTFHYASTLSLCLSRAKAMSTRFTFHYASTLSTVASSNGVVTTAFTFHYASTLSHIELYIGDGQINLHSTMLLLYHLLTDFWKQVKNYLHSTMLLLYRKPGGLVVFRELIYIPLCFYFIKGVSRYICTFSWFTFHYASTLSAGMRLLSQTDFYLHSTMLLLYLRQLLTCQKPNLIYIPLCFYFITRTAL